MAIADRFQLVWTPFLKKQDGKWMQAVALHCPTVLGAGGEFTLHAGSRRLTAHTLDLLRYPDELHDQNLPVRYLWLIPRPRSPVMLRAEWRTPLRQVYRDTLLLPPAREMDVHVIFKTHLDLGYTHPLAEVIRLYQTTFMEKLLANLDATAGRKPGKRFVWTLSTWLLEQCLDPKAVSPDHLRRLEKYIRNGSVVWGLMPFTTHSEFFGLEEMYRSLYAARRLAERFKRPLPRAAKMTDVPAHTAALATAFASAGGTFFQIGTNPESMPPDVPPLFWWKLPDGNRLLCHYHGTYGTPLLPPEDWPRDHWPAIQITSDNVGPQSLETIDQMDWIEKHFDSPRCRTGSLEDFGDAVAAAHGEKLPTIDKELIDWWVYGIASDARHTAMARQAKEELPSVETLSTMASLIADRAPPKDVIEETRAAYQNLALYTEHTWGDHASDARKLVPEGSLFTSRALAAEKTAPPMDRWVASWEDKADFARRATAGTHRLREKAVASFAKGIDAGSGQPAIALFNTLAWARGGPVRMSDAGLPKHEFELIDASTGAPVPYERSNGEIEFVAPTVPPCGYLLLQIRATGKRLRPGLHAEWAEQHLTLHTSDVTYQFHTAGGLARWHDRARSYQWCSGEAEFPMGTYLYEMPGGDKIRRFARQVHSNSRTETPGYFHRRDYEDLPQFGPVGGEPASIRPLITPLYSRVIVEAACPVRKAPGRRSGDARRYRSTFTIYRDRRDLHVSVELFGKQPTYAAEAGYAFFPFSGEDWMLVERISHQMQPHEDLAPSVNAAHMAVSRGLRIEGKHAGVNFYPLHSPLVSFGAPGAYHFDANGDYDSAHLYATLFNNCWGTNFRQWQSGDMRFDFVFRPTGNDDWDGGLAQGGAEVFRPLIPALVRAPRGESSRSLLELHPNAVQLVTLKPAEFARGYILRLWNSSPDPQRATLTFPDLQIARAVKCDALERPGKPLAVRNGSPTLSLRGFEVATLLIEQSAGQGR